MPPQSAEKSIKSLSRREFIQMASLSAAGIVTGCAINPVTGKSQLMLVSEDQEIAIDRQQSPHQFSRDYGPVQDTGLNRYLQETGQRMARHTHRPEMPYSFRAVNATYVNAYAFPGGSIAATRGILISLENEAELAGLLGHEMGHVNARHTAEQMSKGTATQLVLLGATIAASTQGQEWGQLAQVVSMAGGSALLAKYSRDNETEADALGMAYMVKNGYSPQGMVDLMAVLKKLSKHKPGISQVLFASHPMAADRYAIAEKRAHSQYAAALKNPIYRDRYMDHTVHLRKLKGAIETMQKSEVAMARKKFPEAESDLKQALTQAPGDYAGLLMMSKCLLAQNKNAEARRFADDASQVYPEEAQAHQIGGIAALRLKRFNEAFHEFDQYDRLLPGDPNTVFFKGLALEKMHRRPAAAQAYSRYLHQVKQGNMARHAYQRLRQWGYIRQ